MNWSLSGPGTLSGESTTSATYTAPAATGAQQTATITATSVTNTAQSGTVTITIPAAPAVTSQSTDLAGVEGTPYSVKLHASGGISPYSWALSSGTLPSCLTLKSDGTLTTTSGAAPDASCAGTYSNLTFQVTDSGQPTALTATASLSITITAATPLSLPGTLSPATATVGTAYTGSVAATGGLSPLTYSISSGALPGGLSLNTSTGVISGTPNTSGTASFTVKVADGFGDAPASQPYALTVNPGSQTITFANPGPQNVGTPLTLIATSSSGLTVAFTSATTGICTVSGTTATFIATGTCTIDANQAGDSNYSAAPQVVQSFTVNGEVQTITFANPGTQTVGTPLTLSATSTSGLTVSFASQTTSVCTVSGTTATFLTAGTCTIQATQAGNTTYAAATPVTQSFTVNGAGQTVSGQIVLNTTCGGSTVPPAITVKIANSGNTYSATTTTDNNGNFSFSGVPNDTYTITPSISGPGSVFSPATLSVIVNNADMPNENFGVSLGYTVSGTVSYPAATHTGQIYLLLNNSCGNSALGTSITAAGAYAIHGVPPGSYSLKAFMDTQGFGANNANDPSGSDASAVAVSNANVSGADVPLADQSIDLTSTAGPTIETISPEHDSVVIAYKPIMNNNVEEATSYTVEWSTDSTFSTNTGSKTFTATGDGTDIWIVSGLTDGQAYYFRAYGSAGSSISSKTVYGGGTPTAVTVGAPTGADTVTGTVTFTNTATGPLYVGFYDPSNGSVYADVISSPSSPQTYSVSLPSGNYILFGIIDQNSDGLVGPGDITNVKSGNNTTVSIAGNTTQDLILSNANSTAAVTTQFMQQVQSGTTTTGYYLNFKIREGIKLPVTVELTSGPNVVNPIDLGKCTDCGSNQFQYNVGLNSGVTPTVGDSYTFKVTYSDSTSDTLTSQVTGVLTSTALVTNMSPTTGSSNSLTPTFTWTYPANASSYTYEFWINQNANCSGNCTLWQIPGQNSNSNGFTSTDIPGTLTWGTDPTDGTNTPSVGTLTSGTNYSWTIVTLDSNRNQAQSTVDYQP